MAINISGCKTDLKAEIKKLVKADLDAAKSAQGEDATDLSVDAALEPVMKHYDLIVSTILQHVLDNLELDSGSVAPAGVPTGVPIGNAVVPPLLLTQGASTLAAPNVGPVAIPIDGIKIPKGKFK